MDSVFDPQSTVHTRRGRFITFEGPEGGGKSTQVQHLRRRLEHVGVVVKETREPGGTVVGQELRAMMLMLDRSPLAPQTEALLMCADRAQHVAEVIRPALAAGITVISDRYADSTLAHQGFGVGLHLATLQILTRFATQGLKPDLTILVDIDVRLGLERKRVAFRTGDGELNRIDRRGLAYHQRVRDAFLKLAQREPERFFVVDGAQPPEEMSDRIWARVADLLDIQAEPQRLL